MLTLSDCFDMSDCYEDEIRAIAEHEHVPEIVACEMACCLMKDEDGVCMIKQYMLDNIEHAKDCGRSEKAREWSLVYSKFDRNHPTHPLNSTRRAH